jgi:hypothetical protein
MFLKLLRSGLRQQWNNKRPNFKSILIIHDIQSIARKTKDN